MINEAEKAAIEMENIIRTEPIKKYLIPKEPEQIKIDHTFLPLDALDEVSRALMHGEEKYASQLWVTKPHRHRALVAKALRHIFAFQRGENIDSSGLQHIACAICDLMFLQSNILRGTGTDDRLVYPTKEEKK
jgi:hypothetical protein